MKIIKTSRNDPSSYYPGLIFVFFLSLCYWIYLAFNSKMLILCDAIGYESLGKMIYQGNWTEYFTTGPNREPVYPLLVALAMHIADIVSISYTAAAKTLHLVILSITFGLIYVFLKRLNVRPMVGLLTLLYFGFSPAIVNSALSLYSEISTYPIVLIFILVSIWAWTAISQKNTRNCLMLAVVLSALAIGITFTKGIFEIVFPGILFSYIALSAYLFIKSRKQILIHALVFAVLGLSFFQAGLGIYKSLNYKYNGQFMVTSRGPWALYGNTARRMAILTPRQLLAGLSYAPGEGFCLKFFTQEECDYWSFYKSDDLASQKSTELRSRGLSNEVIIKTYIQLSKDLAMRNPVQYGALAFVEALKMLFWESTRIGFVEYPSEIRKIFGWGIFKDGLRLVIFLLTFFALYYATSYVVRHRRMIDAAQDAHQIVTILFCLVFILSFIACHSIFYILTRYALVIAPLYLILIAFTIDGITRKFDV